MRKVTCSMGMSLDGSIVGPDGEFAWTAPSRELFGFSIDEVRDVGVHLLGRRIYESMLFWETVPDQPELGDVGGDGIQREQMQEFAAIWRAIPKVVFSRTLAEVEGNARLTTVSLAEEVERLQAEGGDGSIAVAGADLAAHAAALDLIDEYRIRVMPVLVGGGRPMFPQDERQRDLELLDTRTFDNGVVFLHHRVLR